MKKYEIQLQQLSTIEDQARDNDRKARDLNDQHQLHKVTKLIRSLSFRFIRSFSGCLRGEHGWQSTVHRNVQR